MQDIVSPDPSIEEMKSVVCEQGLRPALPTIWSNHEVIRNLQDIMTECWYASPSARLSAMRVKKSLALIRQQIDNSSNLSKCPSLPTEATTDLPFGLIRYPPPSSCSSLSSFSSLMLTKSSLAIQNPIDCPNNDTLVPGTSIVINTLVEDYRYPKYDLKRLILPHWSNNEGSRLLNPISSVNREVEKDYEDDDDDDNSSDDDSDYLEEEEHHRQKLDDVLNKKEMLTSN